MYFLKSMYQPSPYNNCYCLAKGNFTRTNVCPITSKNNIWHMPNFCTCSDYSPKVSYSISNDISHPSKWWINYYYNFVMVLFSVQKLFTVFLTIRDIIKKRSEQVILLVILRGKKLSL